MITRLNATLVLAAVVLAALFCLPAAAHMPVQLFQGAHAYRSAIIRGLPPDLDLSTRPRLPNGLYRQPPEFHVDVKIESGPFKGKVVEVHHRLVGNPAVDVLPVVGTRVIVAEARLSNGEVMRQVVDYDRRPAVLGGTALAVLAVVGLAGTIGLRVIALAAAAVVLLAAAVLPLLVIGAPAVLTAAVASLFLGGIGLCMALWKDRNALLAASCGLGTGIAVTALALEIALWSGHVSGLGTQDALVLYAQLGDYRQLDYRQLWGAGGLLTTTAGLTVMALATARSLVAGWQGNPKVSPLRDSGRFLPVVALGTGLLYAGLSLPLLLIGNLALVTPIRVSALRFFNYEYLAGVLLTWDSQLLGLVAAWLATAAIGRRILGKSTQ